MISQISLDWDRATAYPLTLAAIKSQLRIEHDEWDSLIYDIHLPAALSWAEGETRRSIWARTHRWVIREFPSGDQRIILPRGKVQSVASIAYVTGGNTTTLTGPSSSSPEGTGYQEDLKDEGGGVLMPNQGESWPSVDLDVPAPITITYSAGWAEQEDVPGDIKLAMIFYIGDALEITSSADLMSNTDLTVKDRLISAWRLRKWYG